MISLIHPSRGRASKAHTTATFWIGQAGIKVDYILSVDSDDSELSGYESWFSLLKEVNINSGNRMRICVNNNKSVVEASNYAAKFAVGDIILYLSDDFKCFDNWGPAILKEFEGVTDPMLIKVDDCLQPFHVPVLTIPIMNRALYNKLGYFWHPDYKSMFCDCHLHEIVKKNGWLKLAPHLKFPHEHVSIGKAQDDETYRRSAANWEQGKALFAKHKSQGFPL